MNSRIIKRVLILTLGLALAGQVGAHSAPPTAEPMNLEGLMQAFNWDMDAAEITVESVGDDLHVLFGLGGNIAVNVGPDGVLIVDDQFPQLMPKILAAINDLGGDEVDFAVTTHWHFDHAEGNLVLGPNGTWLVAQENSRDMMKDDHLINLVVASYMQEAYPESAWPDVTFTDSMKFHLNGQDIELRHFGPAHTTGDTAIIFRGSNAVHMGDVFNNQGYPFIDAGNGGDLEGMIEFCEQTLALIDEDTIVIPGHGPVTDYDRMKEYTVMLAIVRDRMIEMIDAGKSLEEVLEARPTADFDDEWGEPTMFVNRAYMSLTHKRGFE